MAVFQRASIKRSICALFVLNFWLSPLFSKDIFLPFDPGEPIGIEAEPNQAGSTYRVITWTQVIGMEERESGKPPVLKGLVRIAMFGGQDAVTLMCPIIRLDGKTDAMYSRGPLNPDYGCFPVSVCEYPITSENQEIIVVTPDGSRFSAPPIKADVRAIGVIGDTGCRNNKKQACSEQKDWPFKTIADDLANQNPDLLIHVGDYRYSKPVSETLPCQDAWQNWLFEFFLPAKSLLDRTPLLLARGNHESCEGSGPGWFLLLQPERAVYPYRTCKDKDPTRYQYPPVWSFDVGNGADDYRFVVMDSSLASDYPAEAVAAYRILADQVKTAVEGPDFATGALVTHKPVWAVKGDKKKKKLNSTLQEAFENKIPDKIDLIQSGHIHAHQQVVFSDATKRPFQVVTGNSGVSLNQNIKITGKVKLADEKAKVILGDRHGYDLWLRDAETPGSWRRTARFLAWTEDGKPTWSEAPISAKDPKP